MKKFVSALTIAFVLGQNIPVHAAESFPPQMTPGTCEVKTSINRNYRFMTMSPSNYGIQAKFCDVSQQDTVMVLKDLFSTLADNNDSAVYERISMGPIAQYGWLSRHLVTRAANDPRWTSGTATSGPMLSHVVQEILSEPAILDPLNTAAALDGYKITGLSCQNIIVSSPAMTAEQPAWVPADRPVPYNAECALMLVKTGAPAATSESNN